MGVLDAIEARPEARARDGGPRADTRAEPTLGEQAAASFRTAFDVQPSA